MKLVAALVGIFVLASCDAPGRRAVESPVAPPDRIMDFGYLYAHNCAGCHGPNGSGGVAVELANPVYLAIAGDAVLRRVASEGRSGTPMSAFAQKNGGPLTDAQIEAIVNGIRTRWARPGEFANAPSYEAQSSGDAAHGEAVYTANCASCHGSQDRKGPVGAIVDGAFLALTSNQYLRTTIIAGIPTAGMPDWRQHPKPLTNDDVTDVVAWLASQRPPLYVTGVRPGGSR